MNNTESIHGHEVIHMVHSNPGTTEADLAAKVASTYGENATFHACSGDGMSLSDLLVFLAERDKVHRRDGKVFPGGSPDCDHDGEDHQH